ncbi:MULTISPECIES: 1-deoxy-D-xylulose-5-phosphate synthase [Thermoanaerobacter]|uniref:1-deoxy-D-xylulose-5-phosphate synthase n=2 Tax=Thermoanaerobacter TaxID=1754 RepID=B0K9E5_THEP3|nr:MULTISPECIES: 1-deoxy-D-xylulose-5-phosphate synthase [Thermoanaerobacter]ABY94758.1 deoxyxylulose-5-phosphate synthase [Thermoanaerobacter pseudethanolicus ATCC 33223]ADV79706.1 deoxyxylulose-5-phosphate synthase [Thermoanaerobacter brockii subsp. finnii Ako-1]HBW58734.1 1-deoxy-D-xylulose-5-phosphate synthase [Thermoanaerobacter sp.]
MLEQIDSPYDLKKLDKKDFPLICEEIRQFLIEKVSKTGGHLASNLGIVELTIALHYVFNSPVDKIIWDVGHQCYVHKMLTGRKDQFDTLRKFNGLSGYTKRTESVHDIFGAGHSSTSISAALGIAKARDLKGEKYSVVAVIGDGALTGGMAFEALNNAGRSKTDLIVVLNHNEMSISENVGSLSLYLSKLRTDPTYNKLKQEVDNLLNIVPPIGKSLHKYIERIKDSVKQLVVPGMFFEEMGFTYLGPIDGHDVGSLIEVLERAKKIKGPILVHVITKKGKGYKFAEKFPDKFHSAAPFDIQTGKFVNEGQATYSDVFGKTLTEMALQDDKIVAITAAMPEGTGLIHFAKLIPERFFDVGIAEQHATTFAAGMAVQGYKPYFAVYSTFLQRAYDQLIHDVCIQKLPVVFAIDRAGIVGEDGETHQGVFDLSYLRPIPNITIMSPKDANELVEMVKLSRNLEFPVAIRYPRGKAGEFDITRECSIEFGKAELVTEGKEIAIFALGRMVGKVLEAKEILKVSDLQPFIVNLRFVKPLDEELILDISNKVKFIVTVEDNVIAGGVGSAILELLNSNGIYKPVLRLGFPDKFIEHGDVENLFKKYNLDAESIANTILQKYKEMR